MLGVSVRVRLLHGSAVPLGQSQTGRGQEFVKGDVNLGGEVFGEHDGEHDQDAVRQDLRREQGFGCCMSPSLESESRHLCAQIVPHLEVGRVHFQLEGVLLAELEETFLEVIDGFHGQSDATHYLCPVCLDWGGAERQIWPVGEVGLSLGVHD